MAQNPQYLHGSYLTVNLGSQNLYLETNTLTGTAPQVSTTNTRNPRTADGRLQVSHIYDPISRKLSFSGLINLDDIQDFEEGKFYAATWTDGTRVYTGTVGVDSVTRSGGATGAAKLAGECTFVGAVNRT